MSRQEERGRKHKSKEKVFPMPVISVEESGAEGITRKSLELSGIEKSESRESRKEDKNVGLVDDDDEKREIINRNGNNPDSLENNENSLKKDSTKPSGEATGCGDGESDESSKIKEKVGGASEDDNSDGDDNGSSEIILVDEVHNKGGVITRNKAKSVGQVDYIAAELRRRKQGKSPTTFRKAISEEGKLNVIQAEDLEKRLKDLASAFSARTIRTKKKIQQPPTPSSEESETEDSRAGEPTLLDRLRQLASPNSSEFGGDDSSRRKSLTEKVKGSLSKNLGHLSNALSCNYILDPQSTVYINWLLIVSIIFLYNAVVIPLRVVFPYQTEKNENIWLVFDCLADSVYLIDLVAFKPHVKFIQSGFWVKEPKETLFAYLKTIQFKLDLVALLPVDIVVTFFAKNYPLLRLNRFLKVHTFWELFRQLDTYLANPHRARILHTCMYMLYMIHMVACSYYALSKWEGIGTTTWTFDGHGNAYIRCFYFATKTATSIGKNPKPENELEYVFMTFAWLSGVFVFAILIGQIRDTIATATKSQTEYRILTSATISYLHRLGVPRRLQDRVKLWLSYTWEQQKTLDETKILALLPKNMKAEIALNIHVETLAKVKLFQNCETAFLRDLVVKLRSIIILPGDFVCKKGEIGREMFIVKSGKIHVIGGPNGTQVLATLGEGSVFGEIALLGIGGMNKRTADVRAAGFVNLFVLNKGDLNDVIRDYPEAQEIMQRKAKKAMRESIKKARATPSPATTSDPDECVSLVEQEAGIIIKNKMEPPQLISTMLKLFPPSTKIGRYLTQGSKIGSSTDVSLNSSNGNKPEDTTYTSLLTSYPPSPYIPTSPGHISPELDISIMTGDSSEKMLSPPTEPEPGPDSQHDALTLSSEDGYRSDPLDVDMNEIQMKSKGRSEKECRRRSAEELQRKSIMASYKESLATLPRAGSDKLQRSRDSPLSSPFSLRKESISLGVPDVKRNSLAFSVTGNDEKLLKDSPLPRRKYKDPEKSCPNLDSRREMAMDANRDEIPIWERPPLYIIEAGVYNDQGESVGFSGSRGGGSVAVIDSSRDDDELEKGISGENNTISTKTMEMEKVGMSSGAALISSHFISRLRRPLQRQKEVNLEIQEEKEMGSVARQQQEEEQLNVKKNKVSEYSLDLDSD